MNGIFNFIRGLGFTRGPNRIVGGVAGGIARKFGLPLYLVRLVMLVLFLLPGIGVGTYVCVWILTPNTTGGIPLERFLEGFRGNA